MAKVFNKAVALVERIPTIELVVYFLWGLISTLHKDDQMSVIEQLTDRVTAKDEEGSK